MTRKQLVGGLLVGVVVLGGGAYLLFGNKSDDSGVDSAVADLGLVADGIQATNQTQKAGGLAAKGSYSEAARLAGESSDDLSDLRTKATSTGSSPDVVRSLTTASRASREVSFAARGLENAKQAVKGTDVQRLSRAERQLKASSRLARQLTRQLNRSKRLFAKAIRSLTAELERLDSLSDSARQVSDEASTQISEPTPPALQQGMIDQIDTESALLASRLDWVEPRPGPRSCGESDAGVEVVVNSGNVACSEAFFVLDNSSGPNSSTAPDGWDCSSFASDLEGREIQGSAGYSCTGSDSARISFIASVAVSAQALESFQTPSGNIFCRMDEGGARCDISEKIYEPPYRPASCSLDWGNSLAVGSTGPGEVLCAGDTVKDPSAPVLGYGQASTVGSITCTVEESGVSCDNEATGNGFTLSKMSIDLR